MANAEHLKILLQGVEVWNKWRESVGIEVPETITTNLFEVERFAGDYFKADLSGADLREACLRGAHLSWADFSCTDLTGAILSNADLFRANFSGAILKGADFFRANVGQADFTGADLSCADLCWTSLSEANFINANLSGADLRGAHLIKAHFSEANLSKTDLSGADLSEARLSWVDLGESNLSGANLNGARFCGANLREANLSGANLFGADLTGANLSGSNLELCQLVEANLSSTNLSDCLVYGASIWNIKFDGGSRQKNLQITPVGKNESNITVDNLEVAQFIYLLLHNEKIRGVIDTIGQKGVLILGRFTKERKEVLDAIRSKLRALNFVPMMFDFDKPTQRDFTETIKTLSGICRFIIADITNPKSSPLELQATIPDYMIPFIPIIQENEKPFSMFADLQNKYDWVLDVLQYDSTENLIKVFDDAVVKPALEKAEELGIKKAQGICMKHVRDYI